MSLAIEAVSVTLQNNSPRWYIALQDDWYQPSKLEYSSVNSYNKQETG